jgi:hypothetical protein
MLQMLKNVGWVYVVEPETACLFCVILAPTNYAADSAMLRQFDQPPLGSNHLDWPVGQLLQHVMQVSFFLRRRDRAMLIASFCTEVSGPTCEYARSPGCVLLGAIVIFARSDACCMFLVDRNS